MVRLYSTSTGSVFALSFDKLSIVRSMVSEIEPSERSESKGSPIILERVNSLGYARDYSKR